MKKTAAILLALLVLLAAVCVISFADAGGFGGDNDFGGDGDDDDSGGFEFIGDLFLILFSSGPGGIMIALGIIIVIILFFVIKGKFSKEPKYVNVGDRSTPQSALRPMSEYRSLDPDFDEAGLVELISNLYVRLQNRWTAGDLSELRPYFGDALYTQFDRQLAQLRAAGQTNHVDRISVQNVTLRGFTQVGGDDHIIARVETRIVDYTVENATGKIVSGSNTREKFMTYEWDLSRTTGFITLKKDGIGKIFCPNCGAPLDVNVSTRCEYCGSVITSSKHDWAIFRITALSQQTA